MLLQTLVGNQVKESETGLDFSRCGRDEKCVQNLTGRNRRERKLGRPICKWEIIIKIELTELSVMRLCEHNNEDSNSIKCKESLN
jgi:hypothetical protein